MQFEYTVPLDKTGKYAPRQEIIDIEGLSQEDHIVRIIDSSRMFYEQDLLVHLLLHGALGGVTIDIGSHIGNHAIYFGKFIAQHLVCIEPFAKLHPILERNLAVNGIANYSLVRCGLGEKIGSAQLHFPDEWERNTGSTQLISAAETEPQDNSDIIEIKPLDTVVAELESEIGNLPVRLIKIDVEGMHLEVLRGARSVLEKHRPQLVIEAATPEEQTVVNQFLEQFGYIPVARFCYTPTFHYIDPSRHKLRSLTFGYIRGKAIGKIRRIPQKIKRILRSDTDEQLSVKSGNG